MAKRHSVEVEKLREAVEYCPEAGGFRFAQHAPYWWDSWSAKTWPGRFAGKPAFASINQDGYRCGVLCGAYILAHHAAWAIVHGEWAASLDHINGDRGDNRISNLRPADVLRNNWNRGSRPETTSQYVGVCWNRAQQEWRSSIQHEGQKVFLGAFKTEVEAARAYDAANWARAGRYARLNFPEVQHDDAKAGDWSSFLRRRDGLRAAVLVAAGCD